MHRLIIILLMLCLWTPGAGAGQTDVEQWGLFEVSLKGPADGNPFVDVELSAVFRQGATAITVTGFYDGDGTYRIRFMPPQTGAWSYETRSNRPDLNGKIGTLTAIAPAAQNHGPVRVAGQYHFAYADGTPFRQIGTTCYAWTHQGDELEVLTLKTLAASPFNKLRMCVFPKHYEFNTNEPVYYPFAGTPPRQWDFTRFNPQFFQHLEKRIGQLRDLGIEADLILFHPYDRQQWGFDDMGAAADDRYLRYLAARLSAYRNVWWSLANEFDLMKKKTDQDWDRFFQILQSTDPYSHLRSIHNFDGSGWRLYDHSKPWVTHVSIQSSDMLAIPMREKYRKPVIYDECQYEGNIQNFWGSLTAREMVHRFWLATIAGAYAGHGETYYHPQDILWWSKGGTLHGESPQRLVFLRKILEDGPKEGLDPLNRNNTCGREGEYYLVYLGNHQPVKYQARLPQGVQCTAEIIDTWEMTITPVPGTVANKSVIAMPGKTGMAIRMKKGQ
jgi:hypothetical protein